MDEKIIGDVTLRDLSKICRRMDDCNEDCPAFLFCSDDISPMRHEFINILNKKLTKKVQNVIID